MDFTEAKLLIQTYSGLERDALHIHFALFLYLLAALLLRQGRRSVVPWLFVLAVECANELRDYFHVGQALREAIFHECLMDLWNTMLWPTVLLILGRYTRFFAHMPPAARADTDADGVQLELPLLYADGEEKRR